MKRIIGCLVCLLVFATSVLAEGKAKGHDKWHSGHSSTHSAVERVRDAAVDAVVDELVGEDVELTATGSMPPGLAKKGKLPPGLAKQGKTPEGWSHGKKTGWEAGALPAKKASFIQRLVRGIFRRGASPPSVSPDPQ